MRKVWLTLAVLAIAAAATMGTASFMGGEDAAEEDVVETDVPADPVSNPDGTDERNDDIPNIDGTNSVRNPDAPADAEEGASQVTVTVYCEEGEDYAFCEGYAPEQDTGQPPKP